MQCLEYNCKQLPALGEFLFSLPSGKTPPRSGVVLAVKSRDTSQGYQWSTHDLRLQAGRKEGQRGNAHIAVLHTNHPGQMCFSNSDLRSCHLDGVTDGVCCMDIPWVLHWKRSCEAGEALKSDEMLDPFFSYRVTNKTPTKKP